MYAVDLHTHSQLSHDGGISLKDYVRVLQSKQLYTVAVTDHDTIEFALKLHNRLPKQVIIGQEITVHTGNKTFEVIGLYLKQRITPGQTLHQAIAAIKAQHGLVYVPHPFDKTRHGIPKSLLDTIKDEIDIVEVYNGRARSTLFTKQVEAWANKHKFTTLASSSDAHGAKGWGHTYSLVSQVPTRNNLVQLLQTATLSTKSVGLLGLGYPKYNKLKGMLGS